MRVMADTQSKSILNITNLITIGIVIGLIIFIIRIASVLGIFLLSFVIAFLLYPMVEWFTDRKMPRVGAILIVYIIIGALLFGIGAAIVPAVIAQADAFFQGLPEMAARWEADMVPKLEALLAYLNTQGITAVDIQNYLGGEVIPAIQNWGLTLGQKIVTGVQGAVGGIVTMLSVPIIVFYLLLDSQRVHGSLIGLAPKRTATEIQNLLNKLADMLNSYLRGLLKVSFIMFAVTFLVLWALGVKNALLLGVIAGVTEVIPIIGPIIALIPALLISYFLTCDGGVLGPVEAGWIRSLVVLAFYMVLQYVEGNIIVPRVMGKDLNLHPLTVMFSLLAGGYLAGIFGMILALPIAACLKVIFDTYYPAFIQRVEDLMSRMPRTAGTNKDGAGSDSSP